MTMAIWYCSTAEARAWCLYVHVQTTCGYIGCNFLSSRVCTVLYAICNTKTQMAFHGIFSWTQFVLVKAVSRLASLYKHLLCICRPGTRCQWGGKVNISHGMCIDERRGFYVPTTLPYLRAIQRANDHKGQVTRKKNSEQCSTVRTTQWTTQRQGHIHSHGNENGP